MTDQKDDLLPCPFCGGEAAIVTIRKESYGYWPESIAARCTRCYTHAPKGAFDVTRFVQGEGHIDVREEAKAKAIAAWNTRSDLADARVAVAVDIATRALAAIHEVQTYEQPDDPWAENALTMHELDAFDFDVESARAALAKING